MDEELRRSKAIQTISSLYPADSEYERTSQIGQELLDQAKREVSGWQTEPTEILVRYADLCEQYHEKECRAIRRIKKVSQSEEGVCEDD